MEHGSNSKQRALVTGASSGIGEAYARRLAQDGCDLLLVARRAERLGVLADQLSRAHGIQAVPLPADLATDAGIGAVERAVSDGPPLAWLIGCAGFGTRGRFVDVAPDQVRRMVRLHIEANVRLVRSALPGMIALCRGAVVMVSSLSAFLTTAEYVSYSASKAYLNMLVLGLRDELLGTGVHVQALCPGLTRTGFLETDEFKDFKYDGLPSWVWMSAGEVVEQSRRALEHSERRPIVIPGRANRAFLAVMETPLLGAAMRAALGRLGRGRKIY